MRPFQASDVEHLQPQREQASELASIGDWRVTICQAASCGPAWTVWLDERAIACAGVALRWTGRATLWAVLEDDIPVRCWLALHRAVLARIPPLLELGVRRLEAEAQCGFEPSRRWLRMLGFEEEGLMRRYGPGGEDFYRFARLLEFVP